MVCNDNPWSSEDEIFSTLGVRCARLRIQQKTSSPPFLIPHWPSCRWLFSLRKLLATWRNHQSTSQSLPLTSCYRPILFCMQEYGWWLKQSEHENEGHWYAPWNRQWQCCLRSIGWNVCWYQPPTCILWHPLWFCGPWRWDHKAIRAECDFSCCVKAQQCAQAEYTNKCCRVDQELEERRKQATMSSMTTAQPTVVAGFCLIPLSQLSATDILCWFQELAPQILTWWFWVDQSHIWCRRGHHRHCWVP